MRLNELKRASLMLTTCLTLVFCSSALAENPASSTSEKQAEKEQLKIRITSSMTAEPSAVHK